MPAAPAPSAAPTSARRALLVVLGGFVCQLALGYGNLNGHVLNDITSELGFTRAEFASVRIPQMLMMSIASPIAAWVLVRFGARPILALSVVCLFAGQWTIAHMTSLAHFGSASALQGFVSVGLGDVVVGAVVARWVSRARGLALGIVFAGSNVAAFAIAKAVPPLAASGGWRSAVLQLGIAGSLLIAPFALGVVRFPRVGEPGGDDVDAHPSTLAGGGAASRDLGLREAMRTRSFWILAYALAAFFFVFVGVLDHLVAFLRDEGLPHAEASGALALASMAGLIAKPLFGALADQFDRRYALWFQFALFAVGTTGLLALPSPAWMAPVLVAFGFATASRDVSYPLIIEHCFGRRHLAEIYGALMFLLWAGGVGTVAAGAMYDATGTYDGAFALFAALGATSFLATLFVRREVRSAA